MGYRIPFIIYNFTKKMNTKITSSRTFGVELESFSSKMESVIRFAEAKGHTHESDGSIDEDSGYDPREIQTKVLKGDKGADELRELCNFMIENDTKTNTSCGTHIHFGGEGFHNFKRETSVKLTHLKTGVLMFPRLYSWVREGLERDSVEEMLVSREGREDHNNVFFIDSMDEYKKMSKAFLEYSSITSENGNAAKDKIEHVLSLSDKSFFGGERLAGRVEGLIDGRNVS